MAENKNIKENKENLSKSEDSSSTENGKNTASKTKTNSSSKKNHSPLEIENSKESGLEPNKNNSEPLSDPKSANQEETDKKSKSAEEKTTENNSTEKSQSERDTPKTSEKKHNETQEPDVISSEEEQQEDEYEAKYEEEIPMKSYDEMNLDALTEELERLLKTHPVKKIRAHVREIKMEFDLKFGKERKQKKEAYLKNGGNIIDFAYSTPVERKFNKLYFEYKEKRDNYYKNVRKNLQENLERRLAIIEELKGMIGVGNDMNANFQKFKKLQDHWRKAGPVPRNDYKDTWSTYHHHVERFYEFLHLDREFRELDYKYNLEQKLKMIARAEELAEETNINRAFRELQNLHRMWKEDVGPVAQKYSEPIWEKFSAATKKIHENRKAYYEELDKEREKNLGIKQEIIAKIEALEANEIKSHRQAQQEIKEFKDLRDKFFKAGRVSKKNNQEVWDAFKSVTREFNHKKNEFYRNRKNEQKENLDKKLELIKIAEEHKDSEDFEVVTPLMKKIQNDWRKIGYVQRSKSDKIWKRFKKACNHYFERLHALQNKKDKVALEAFDKKNKLLDEVKNLNLSGNRDEDLPKLKEQIEIWKKIGPVPKNKKYIEGKFNKTLDKLFSQLDLNRKEAEMLKYENRLQTLENAEDEDKIIKESNFLRKKIDQTSHEIRQLETNLGFFNYSNKDNPLMKEALHNIEKHKQQLKIWKAKLTKLRAL